MCGFHKLKGNFQSGLAHPQTKNIFIWPTCKSVVGKSNIFQCCLPRCGTLFTLSHCPFSWQPFGKDLDPNFSCWADGHRLAYLKSTQHADIDWARFTIMMCMMIAFVFVSAYLLGTCHYFCCGFGETPCSSPVLLCLISPDQVVGVTIRHVHSRCLEICFWHIFGKDASVQMDYLEACWGTGAPASRNLSARFGGVKINSAMSTPDCRFCRTLSFSFPWSFRNTKENLKNTKDFSRLSNP